MRVETSGLEQLDSLPVVWRGPGDRGMFGLRRSIRGRWSSRVAGEMTSLRRANPASRLEHGPRRSKLPPRPIDTLSQTPCLLFIPFLS